jgi:hypothetical protein
MKQVVISAVVAAIVAGAVSVGAVRLSSTHEQAPAVDVNALAAQLATHKLLVDKFTPPVLSYTAAPDEDGWVDGSRGAGADHRSLAPAANSICFLTKVEIQGIRAPEDSNMCSIDVDEFTGYWQLTAEVGEGGHSQVRCNARCLTWK